MDVSYCPKASKSLAHYQKSCPYLLINYLGHRAFKCLHSLHYYPWRISKTKIRSCLNNFWTSYFTCILGTVCLPDWKNAQCKLSLTPCWSVLDFWKINLEKSGSTNWIFSLFLQAKNSVCRTWFLQLDFFKNQVQINRGWS